MSSLPEDVWVRVLEFGTERCRLDYRDLCRLAGVNSKFNQLSSHPSLWATLLSHDFPSSHYPSSDPLQNHYIGTSWKKNKWQNPKRDALLEQIPIGLGGIICPLSRLLREPFNPSELLFNIIDVYCHHTRETSVNIPNSTGPGNPPQDCITDQRTLRLHKLKRGCNIGPKPKAIPNSRYYVPLNKPRRQAMPRKI